MSSNPDEFIDPNKSADQQMMEVDEDAAERTSPISAVNAVPKSEPADDITPESSTDPAPVPADSTSSTVTPVTANSMDIDENAAVVSSFLTSLKHGDTCNGSAAAGGGAGDDSGDAADALSTLASAALGQDQALKQEFKETKMMAAALPAAAALTPPIVTVPAQPPKIETSPWCDVGVIKGTSCVIKHFYQTNYTDEHTAINADELPEYVNCQKIELLPGTAYKFRVCAINAYGRGEWSDVSAFKTCLPGFPGAPSSIKISKSAEGAHLSWEPPPANSGKIVEYSVCLAVRNATIQSQGDSKTITSVPGQLAFVRVYCGPQNQAIVYNSSLSAAHIDTTAKPAIIFRIAAKNDKGYGPATQVRWLQDSPSTSSKSTPTRREKAQHGTPSKKYKSMNSY